MVELARALMIFKRGDTTKPLSGDIFWAVNTSQSQSGEFQAGVSTYRCSSACSRRRTNGAAAQPGPGPSLTGPPASTVRQLESPACASLRQPGREYNSGAPPAAAGRVISFVLTKDVFLALLIIHLSHQRGCRETPRGPRWKTNDDDGQREQRHSQLVCFSGGAIEK